MAVYTEVPDEDLARFIAGYDIGDLLSLKGIAEGVENSNFLLRTTAGQYILTLYEKRVRADDIPFFVGLMEHVARNGITCPVPVKDRRGQSIGTLCGRPAAIVSFLDGVWMRRPQVHHCAAVGQALARFHAAALDFGPRRENDLSFRDWRRLAESAGERADSVRPGLAEQISGEIAHLEAHWPHDLPRGVIHADLFPDNVFFIGTRLSGLIDFYFACNDLLAYDLAICLNAWCFEPDNSYNFTKGRALLAAYDAERPLSDEEIAAFPLLARGSAMRFLLTRLVDWLSVPAGALVKPKDPLEYDRKLRFHQSAQSISAYGWQR